MKKVLISGAGIAGPALAHGLSRQGVDCTIVERASGLREGGQAVDFRGPIHREVLERMSLWNAIHERRTTPGDLVLLNGKGEPSATLPAVMTAGDVEILRGDLCALLHERTRDGVDYRFGDQIASLEDGGHEVNVVFASGRSDAYDAVVGADGLHSHVRALAMAPERDVLRHHGYRIATFPMDDVLALGRGSQVYSTPGRAVSVAATGRGGARALLVHRGGPYGDERWDIAAQRRALRETFGGAGWETARVLDALDETTELYVDAVATVHVPRWSRGRVVLLGDAACGGTLGGQGTSLAIVGAYVLAMELARSEPQAAFARYESRMRAYALVCQKGAMRVGQFFAPTTRMGIAVRNFVYGALTSRWLIGFFEKLVKEAASDFELPEHARP